MMVSAARRKLLRRALKASFIESMSLYLTSWIKMPVVFAWFRRSRKRRRALCALLLALNETEGNTQEEIIDRLMKNWLEKRATTFTENNWIEFFKMRKHTFYRLVDFVKNHIERDGKPGDASPVKCVAIALYQLASGQTTKTTSQLLDVDEAIVISSLNRFVKAMLNKKSELIMMPTFDEARQISDRFEAKFKCPQVIGTLGSIHIPEGVLNERRSASHKAMSRPVLQALVDDEYKFRDIFITTTVKSNYAKILEESKLYEDGLPEYSLNIDGTEVPFYVAANNEYPLLPWVITPFHDSKIEGYKERESFNEQLSSILQQVEIAFARLKTRWKILQSTSFMSNHNAKDIITVCCLLHNLCEATDSPVGEIISTKTHFSQLKRPDCTQMTTDGENSRNALCAYLAKQFPLNVKLPSVQAEKKELLSSVGTCNGLKCFLPREKFLHKKGF